MSNTIKYLPTPLLAHYNILGRMAARWLTDREKLEEYRGRLLGALEAAYEQGVADGAMRMGMQLDADNEVANMLADAARPACLVAGDEVEVINYYTPSQITGVVRANSDDGTLFVDAAKVGSATKPAQNPPPLEHSGQSFHVGDLVELCPPSGNNESAWRGTLFYSPTSTAWYVDGKQVTSDCTLRKVLGRKGNQA